MSHIRIDNAKATKKWAPVLENMGVTGERVEWMAEYAEFHSINENAYVNAANVAGMGGVFAGQPAAYAGQTIGGTLASTTPGGTIGSGDVGQNLLPVAMKIAAQTIGLDLVAVKPTPGPKIDLLYVDFVYDNVDSDVNERPQVFKLVNTLSTAFDANINAALKQYISENGGTLTTGGINGLRVFTGITASTSRISNAIPGENGKKGLIEFLGFSRVDGFPMFRAFRQANTAGQFNFFKFEEGKNTFSDSGSMLAGISHIGGTNSATALPANSTIELVHL
jgi:hypothetical protein